MRVLELFKGTGSVSKVFADAGCEVVSLDIVPKFNPTHLCDILDFDYKQYQPKHFDIIWASPECKIYSQLQTTNIGATRKFKTRGDLDQARQEHSKYVEKVLEITGGKKLPVVYDSIGKDTWLASLDVLRPRGMMVSFGQASGPIPPVDLGVFAQKGSLVFTRPTLMTFTATKEGLAEMANDLFAAVASGKVRINIDQTYALADAVKAHQDLEGRKTTGSTILLP